MKKIISLLAITLFCITQSVWANPSNPRIRLETNKGTIILELDQKSAPETVDNFLGYVRNGFYNGTIFHRVIRDFMIQGGGFTANMHQKPTRAPITNEADNGLGNLRGTVAMARAMDPHSATAQFFINTVDNPFLDHKGKDSRGWGYCVFGKVVEGMHVVDAIASLPTITKSGFDDVPASLVIIEQTTFDRETKSD